MDPRAAADRNGCASLNGSFSVSALFCFLGWDKTVGFDHSPVSFCDLMNFPGRQRYSYLGCLCSNSQGHISSGLYSGDSNYFLLA